MMVATLAHALIALFGCAALVILTTVMHANVSALATSMDVSHRASLIESRLLVHRMTHDPAVRGTTSGALLASAEELRAHGAPEVSPLTQELVDQVGRYVSAPAEPASDGLFASTLATAHRLVIDSAARADRAETAASRTDSIANVLGIIAALVLAMSVSLFLVWLWRTAFRPIGALSSAMGRFAAGDMNARADESGPKDFSAMAHSFNRAVAGLQRSRNDQLSYTAALLHDLRTPLSALQLATQFVADDRPVPPERRIRELFATIKRQLGRLNGIVGDGLGLLRAESGDIEIFPQSCDMNELAGASVEALRTVAPAHELELHRPDHPVSLKCDRPRVEQLINNLLSNAVKYSPPGSRVTVTVEDRPTTVALAVEDEGRGIAPEDQERIFKPFQRAISAHEEISGVGLGLYASKCVAQAHGGTVRVKSLLGKGSLFEVELPKIPRGNDDGHPPGG
jgi:signal transduction histidine kinase